MATEEVKIVVSGEVQKFHSAMAEVHNSLQQTANLASNLKFEGATQGLKKLGDSALKSSKDGLSIKEAFAEIGRAKLPIRDVKDLRVVFEQLASLVANLAPVIKMANSALTGFVSGKIQDLIKLFGGIEKGSRVFLWLRKILPIREFRESGVAAKRFNQVIKGTGESIGKVGGLIARSFRAMGSAAKGATDEVIDSVDEMESRIDSATSEPRTINISGGWGIPNAGDLDSQIGGELERASENATIEVTPEVSEPELPNAEEISIPTSADIIGAISGLDQLHDKIENEEASVEVSLDAPDANEIATEVKSAVADAQSVADSSPVSVSSEVESDLSVEVDTGAIQTKLQKIGTIAKGAGAIAAKGFAVLGVGVQKASRPIANIGKELLKLPWTTVKAGAAQVRKEIEENEGKWRATRAAFATTGAVLKPVTVTLKGVGIAAKVTGGVLARLAKMQARVLAMDSRR